MPTVIQIITGILGSGKTTTLRHLLEGAATAQAGVVVGEYADDGFDGDMIRASGARVREITATGRGSGAKSYLAPARAFVREGTVGRVFIETSGVTDIARVVSDLANDADIQSNGLFGPTVVVLDAGAFAIHDQHFAHQLWSQIDIADIVVLNKVDKAGEADLEDTRRRIVARNEEANVLFTYMGQVHRPTVLGIPYEGFQPRALRAEWTDSLPAEFESFVYRSTEPCYDRVMFGHKLLNLPGGRIARFKGVLRGWNKSYMLNGLPGQLDWDNHSVDGDTRIAFIGLGLAEREAPITALLDAELERQRVDIRDH